MSRKISLAPKRTLSRVTSARFSTASGSKISLAASSISKKQLQLEQRCYKHSPRVKIDKTRLIPEANYEFEAKVWRETFNTMNRLQRLNLKEATPFTTLNKAPYHCLSLSREYKVKYGKISHVEGGSVKGISKPQKEHKVSACNCLDALTLLHSFEPLRIDAVPMRILKHTPKQKKAYMPVSAVVVRWDDLRYNAESICEWLLRFGPFYTLYKGYNLLLAVFEDIKASYKAVNSHVPNSGLVVTWNDLAFHNYGHYRLFENYTLNKDKIWQNSTSRHKKKLSHVKVHDIGKVSSQSRGKTVKF